MVNADFWRDLADKFRAIRDPHQTLRAEWYYVTKVGEAPPKTAQWHLAGWPSAQSASKDFDTLARRAGIEIDPAIDSLTAWLEVLKREGINADIQTSGVESSLDGTVVARYLGGTIQRVCQASAGCCKVLQSRALEAE